MECAIGVLSPTNSTSVCATYRSNDRVKVSSSKLVGPGETHGMVDREPGYTGHSHQVSASSVMDRTAVPAVFRRLIHEREFEPVHLVDMLITEDCNCRCDYCFIEGKRPQRMSEETVHATIDFLLLKSRHLRKGELLFFGGEPLTAFDLMQLTVDYGNYQAALMGKGT